MKHLSKKEIIDHISDSAAKAIPGERLYHINHCSRCKRLYLEIEKIYKPSLTVPKVVPENIEKRIFETYQSISTGEPRQSINNPWMKPLFKPLLAAAGLVIIISTGLLVNQRFQFNSGPFVVKDALTLSILAQSSTINGKKVSGEIALHETDLISTQAEGSALITAQELFIIRIDKNSYISIDTARTNITGDLFRHAFTFQKGSLIARFTKSEYKNDYTFVTPHARLDSIGTVFMLTVDKQKTSLYLASGTCRLTSLTRGESVLCKPGYRYEFSTGTIQTRLTDEEINSIETMQFPVKFSQKSQDRISSTGPTKTKKSSPDKNSMKKKEAMRDLKSNSREIRKEMKMQGEHSHKEFRQMRNQNRGHR